MITCCSYQLYHLFGKLLCSLTSITTFTICSSNFKISVLGPLFFCVYIVICIFVISHLLWHSSFRISHKFGEYIGSIRKSMSIYPEFYTFVGLQGNSLNLK